MKKPEILIIGGGIIGIFCAYYLALRGIKTAVFERGGAGRESSWAGGGILSPLYPWTYSTPVTELACWSQQHYFSLCAKLKSDTGIDPEWHRSGFLSLEVENERDAVLWAQKYGHKLEHVEGNLLYGLEPVLAKKFTHALWMPEIAQVRNPQLLKSLTAWLKLNKVDIREFNRVVEILTENGNVKGVKTAQGNFYADTVIIAGGAWSGRILAATGCRVEINPVKGQMIMYRALPGLINRMIIHNERYLIPRRDGRILFGSTLEHEGFDKTADITVRDELDAGAQEIAPELSAYPIERHWAGLRPGSPEGVPYIGEHPRIKGLFVNAGHFRNGVVTAPASAQLLTGLILGEKNFVDAEKYRIDDISEVQSTKTNISDSGNDKI